MAFFNLAEANKNSANEFIRKYVEAMGAPAYRNRKTTIQWWDYDQISKSPSADFTAALQANPDMVTLMVDAEKEFQSIEASQLKRYCTMDSALVHDFNKVYIGYNTESGGYLLSIGPYKNIKGEQLEISEEQPEEQKSQPDYDAEGNKSIVPRNSARPTAWDRFFFYVLKRSKPTPQGVATSVSNNIKSYLKYYGVSLAPSDFYLSYTVDPKQVNTDMLKEYAKSSSGTFADVQGFMDAVAALPPSSEEKAGDTDTDEDVINVDNEVEVAKVDNMVPQNPQLKEFLDLVKRNPMPRLSHALIRPNSKAMEKIMKSEKIKLGPWWEQAVVERAKKEGKKPTQLMEEIMTSQDFIESLYETTVEKFRTALADKNPATVGVPKPPFYSDISGGTSGAQVFTSVDKSKAKKGHVGALLALRTEIIDALRKGITDPEEIADVINANPDRARRINRKKKGERVGVSPQAIEQQMAAIYKDKGEKDIGAYAEQHAANVVYQQSAMGYDDFQTAFDMCVAYIATQVEDIDPLTGAAVGGAASVLGEIPETFHNHTRDELLAFREQCVLKQSNAQTAIDAAKEQKLKEKQMDPKKLQKQIKKDIGKQLKPKVMPNETEVVPPGAEPEVEPKTPQKVPQNVNKPSVKKRPQPNVVTTTLKNLIRIAAELDDDGKDEAAEEVHKVIRKYQERL